MADRRSLMPNTVLHAVRELEFQMSRQEFAAAVRTAGRAMGENVGCDARLVAAWEDGDVGCPRAVYQRILTRMTGRSMAGLGFRIAPALSVPPAAAYGLREESDPVERRNFLLDGTSIALGPLTTKKNAPGKIGAAQVRAVTRAVAELYTTDHAQGSASLRRAAAEALHTAYQWLQNGTFATSRTEATLRSATGALSIAAGWLSFDSGRAGDAHSLLRRGLGRRPDRRRPGAGSARLRLPELAGKGLRSTTRGDLHRPGRADRRPQPRLPPAAESVSHARGRRVGPDG